jgi:hypothetical protein
VSGMFFSVQRTLQISLFRFCCCPVRSPLFRGVVVKLSSTGVTSKLAFYNRRGLCSTAVTDKKLLSLKLSAKGTASTIFSHRSSA